jgi:hypothetical protein
MPPLSRYAVGPSAIEAGGATLGEVFGTIAALYPELGGKLLDKGGLVFSHLIVLVDGRSIRGEGLELTAVKADSTVEILDAMAGG